MADILRPRIGGDYESLYRQNIELRRQVDQLSTMREIGLAIYASLEWGETLPAIANVVQGALEVRRLTIYELENRGDILKPVIAKYGADLIGQSRLEGETEPCRGTPFGRAIDNRAPVLENEPHRSTAYVPLFARNMPLGVLVLQDRLDGLPFSAEDAQLFQQMAKQIAIAMNNAQLYAMAVTDGLTGLYVRRYFDLRMEEEFAAAKRYSRMFSLLLFDIDHFKRFNDTHGHQTGDLVLRQFADLLRDNTRKADICCRYGGEEMAIILPATEIEEAALLADKLCGRIRRNLFQGAGGEELRVTSSIGVAGFNARQDVPGDVVAAADEMLYQAKENGRDRVEVCLE